MDFYLQANNSYNRLEEEFKKYGKLIFCVDFDDTIYNGDTNRDILMYGFKKHPFLVLKALKKAKKLQNDYKRGVIEFERVKEAMLSFIFKIKNYPKFINDFVDSHMKNIKPWYLNRRTQNDIIISASW